MTNSGCRNCLKNFLDSFKIPIQYKGKPMEIAEVHCSTPQPPVSKTNPSMGILMREKKINFPDVVGSPVTRVQLKNDKFIEANWITEDKIAAGYPTLGYMREAYWEMIETLKTQGHTPIIVSLIHEKQVSKFGDWFYRRQESDRKNDPWEETTEGGATIINYPEWEDYAGASVKVVDRLVRYVADLLKTSEKGVVISNCRGSVGRTGTFLTALDFYQQIQGGDRNSDHYTVEKIMERVQDFRKQRGSDQFVQVRAQQIMLCKLVKSFLEE